MATWLLINQGPRVPLSPPRPILVSGQEALSDPSLLLFRTTPRGTSRPWVSSQGHAAWLKKERSSAHPECKSGNPGTGQHALPSPLPARLESEKPPPLVAVRPTGSRPGPQHPSSLSSLASEVWAFPPTRGAALTLEVLGDLSSHPQPAAREPVRAAALWAKPWRERTCGALQLGEERRTWWTSPRAPSS